MLKGKFDCFLAILRLGDDCISSFAQHLRQVKSN
jgi:hypothetical protein